MAECSETGCGSLVWARGLCATHYQRRRRNNSLPLLPKINAGFQCVAEGCKRSAVSRRMCLNHYEMTKRNGAPVKQPKQITNPEKECSIDGCKMPVRARGLCAMHHGRVARHGDPEHVRPKHAARFKPYIDDQGYVLIRAPDHPRARRNSNRVPEHQLVMEQCLGRYLLPGENVHHKNGIKTDNRPQNLELWVRSQPSGQRPEDLVAWAHEIIARYGAMVDQQSGAAGHTEEPTQ